LDGEERTTGETPLAARAAVKEVAFRAHRLIALMRPDQGLASGHATAHETHREAVHVHDIGRTNEAVDHVDGRPPKHSVDRARHVAEVCGRRTVTFDPVS
jgi:hypothetical protein